MQKQSLPLFVLCALSLAACNPTPPEKKISADYQAPVTAVAPPTNLRSVCYNDAVALGLMLGLAARGVRPGKDFALTGFDDIPEAALASPPLTTVAVQPRERGRQAAELLLQRLGTHAPKPRQIVAAVQLKVRASSPAPA